MTVCNAACVAAVRRTAFFARLFVCVRFRAEGREREEERHMSAGRAGFMRNCKCTYSRRGNFSGG